METTPSIWKACLKYGLILALVTIVMTMIFYMLDLTFAKWVMIPNLALSLIVLFLLQRSYRDTYENGFISYGKALGSGIIIFLYCTVISVIFTYILYKFIDPGLVDKAVANSVAQMEAKGIPQSAMDAATEMQKKIMRPGIISLLSIFPAMLGGVIMSLITSIFVAKKGNPLVEE